MNVWQVLDQFTSLDFTLVLVDVGYLDEIYRGPARGVQGEPEAYYNVTAIEPPRRAGEVILHVDAEDDFVVDDYEYIATDA